MALNDRHFINTLPDFAVPTHGEPERRALEEEAGVPIPASGVGVNTTGVQEGLVFPAPDEYLAAGLSLLDEILASDPGLLPPPAAHRAPGQRRNPFLYTGDAGIAFLCLRAFRATGERSRLDTCLRIVDRCASLAGEHREVPTFLCGQAGVYALGAAAAAALGDAGRQGHYEGRFADLGRQPWLRDGQLEGAADELLYGRAGFLAAARFLNFQLGSTEAGRPPAVPDEVTVPVVSAILESGRRGAAAMGGNGGGQLGLPPPPLMWEWHGTRYFGAAHGVAGICHLLLHWPLGERDMAAVRGTLDYLLAQRLPSGNFPSSEGRKDDRLVHWCHGAPGVLFTLTKAAEAIPDGGKYLNAALEAGDVVWEWGLLRRLGLCHGASGNAYCFLALHLATGGGQKHLHRAHAFASFLLARWRALAAAGEMHGGDHPDSLLEGRAGLACLLLDMAAPGAARFPAYDFQ